MNGRTTSRGIGILEILVVIVVLSVLSTFFLIYFKQIRIVSYDIACSSNLREIAQAGLRYTKDRNGKLPDLLYWGDERTRVDISEHSMFHDELLGNTSLLSCPAAMNNAHLRPYVEGREWNRTYGINVFTVGSNRNGGGIDKWEEWSVENPIIWNIMRIKEPHETPFFMDGAGLNSGGTIRYSTFNLRGRISSDPKGVLGRAWSTVSAHSGNTINVVFIDGRVASLPREEVLLLKWTGM